MLFVFLFLLVLVGGFFILPVDGFSWGPGVHTFITSSVDLNGISNVISKIASRFYPQFIWGSIMADIIIGKNFSNWARHPHNWEYVFPIFEKADRDFLIAFMIGYMCHLAQDVIAHNLLVPDFTLYSAFSGRYAGPIHFKVEAEADKLVPRDVWKKINEMQRIPENKICNEFLEGNLKGTIVKSTKANTRLYIQVLKINALKEFMRSKFKLSKEPSDDIKNTLQKYIGMAKKATEDFLKNFDKSYVVNFDPTGIEPIYVSTELGKSVKKIMRKKGSMNSNGKSGRSIDPSPFFRALREFQPSFGKRTPVLDILKT